MTKNDSSSYKIIGYDKAYRQAFKDMNEAWISRYFRMEEADYKALDHPEEYIIEKGGQILFVLDGNTAVATCALIVMDEQGVELAKMAVREDYKGRGLGYILGKEAIERARKMGAKRVFLESNTILEPAIKLYYKLGFKKIEAGVSPYERANIQMELLLD